MIEVSPKFIVETKLNSFIIVWILETTKDLIVNLNLLSLLSSSNRQRRVVHSTPTTLVIFHHHWRPKKKKNERKENARKWEKVRENKDRKAVLHENSEANLDQRKKPSTYPIEHVSRKSFQPISIWVPWHCRILSKNLSFWSEKYLIRAKTRILSFTS